MAPIHLNRQFKNPNINEDDYSYLLTETASRATFGWDEVLQKQLVVVLASASSGKTFEFQEKAKELSDEGYTSFFFAIEDIAEEPIEDLLTDEQLEHFRIWKSEQGAAYFFLDSVDEAKLKSKASYRRALRRVAKFVGNQIDRAHIYISCRPSDWKKKEDETETLKIFGRNKIAIEESIEEAYLLPEKSRNEIWQIVRERVSRDRTSDGQQETEISSNNNTSDLAVYHLAPLDDVRQRRLAALASNITDIDPFMSEIENRGLEPFSKRPGDLLDLAEYWKANGKFGSLQEMTEFGISKLLNEEKSGRKDSANLSQSKAREGAERLAIALILSKRLSILKPGASHRDSEDVPIAARDVLNDWTDTEIDTLLRRGIFAPASFNAIRFQHRSTIEFLAATWFKDKLESPSFRNKVEDIIFRDAFDVESITKELRPVVAWLALWDDKIRDEVLRREPFELIRNGDPKSFSIPFRCQILSSYADASLRGDVAEETVERRAIWSLSDPQLADAIRDCWAGNDEYRFRSFLIDLIAEGKIEACKDLVLQQVMIDGKVGSNRLSATKCLFELSATDDLNNMASAILTDDLLVDELLNIQSSIIEELFPTHISLDQLVAIVRDSEKPTETLHNGYGWRLPTLFQKCPKDQQERFLNEINNLVTMQPHERDYQPFSERHGYLASYYRKLSRTAIETMERPEDSLALGKTVILSSMADQDGFVPRFEKSLTDIINENAGLNRQCFFQDIELHTLIEEEVDCKKTPWRMFSGIFKPTVWAFSVKDIEWLSECIENDAYSEHVRQACFYVLMTTCGKQKDPATYDKLLSKLSALNENCRHWLRISKKQEKPNPRLLKLERKRKVRKALAAKKEDDWADSWLTFKDAMNASKPEANFTDGISKESWWLMHSGAKWLLMGDDNFRSGAIRQWRGLEDAFGQEIAQRYAEHMKLLWRETKPERPVWNGNTCTTKWRSMYAFSGIGIESDSNLDWLINLNDGEYARACNHLLKSESSIPDWCAPLLKARSSIAVPELRKEIVREWKSTSNVVRRFLSYFSQDDVEIFSDVGNAIFSVITHNVPGNIDAWAVAASVLRKMKLSNTQKKRLLTVVKKRLKETHSAVSEHVALFNLLFWLDPESGLEEVLRLLGNANKETAEQLFGSLFSTFLNGRTVVSNEYVPIRIISQLLDLAYEHVKLAEDEERPSGTHSASIRQQAQDARNSLLNMLLEHPSEAAYLAMRTLAQREDFGISEMWFNVLSKRMAERELEFKPWSPAQILEFHSEGTLPIQTMEQFFRMVTATLAEIQDEFDNEDFSDRGLVQKAKIEAEVRDWLGKELRLRIGNYASNVKEAEVYDAKKPDIIVTSRDIGDEVVIELKHSDQGYTIDALTNTLTNQILKKYLRVDRRSHGILYVSHHERSYWIDSTVNKRVDFNRVCEILNQESDRISADNTPSVKICMIGLETGALEAKKLRIEEERKKQKRAATRAAP